MPDTAESGPERLSRRGLFGAGLGRALDARLAALDAASLDPRPPAHRARAVRWWREGDSHGLGGRLEPAAQVLLDAVGVGAGATVADLTAGDGALAALAAHAGAAVTAVETDPSLREAGRLRCAEVDPPVDWHASMPDSIRSEDRTFDAVVSNFTASHHADQRRVARAMTRAASPGAPIALTAWRGLMARVMAITAPDRPGRSERWGRYETARLHFCDFPDLSVSEHTMVWRFEDSSQAVQELSAPVGTEEAGLRLRDALPGLVETYGISEGDGLELRADYVVVFARRP